MAVHICSVQKAELEAESSVVLPLAYESACLIRRCGREMIESVRNEQKWAVVEQEVVAPTELVVMQSSFQFGC